MKGMYMGSPDTVIYLRERCVVIVASVDRVESSFHSPGENLSSPIGTRGYRLSSPIIRLRLVLDSDLLYGTLVIRVHFFKLRFIHHLKAD